MGIFSSKSPKDKSEIVIQNSKESPKTPREIIAEKYRKQNERSQFILEEIERVKQFKQEIEKRFLKK